MVVVHPGRHLPAIHRSKFEMRQLLYFLLALLCWSSTTSGKSHFHHIHGRHRLRSPLTESRSTESETTNATGAHELTRRDDFTCGVGNPCRNGACCGESGWCGYGPTYCGDGCTSNCDAVSECGKYSKTGKATCPLNTCCSEHGFCGTTEEYCNDSCQSNCVVHPKPPSGSSEGKALSKVIGYYEAWNERSECHQASPKDLPLDALTHLNYAFAYLDPNTFRITTMDAKIPVSLFDDFSELKSINPDLQLFVSIGGWTFSDNGTYTQPIFGNIARTSSNREKFANEVVSFLNYYGFDGIDIDWEYPGAPDRGGHKEDIDNYVLMMKAIREKMDRTGRRLGLTFTAPSSYWYLKWFDLPGLMKYADWVNLMSYDLHGTWDSTNPIGAFVHAHTNLTEIKLAAELFWRVKIPTHKIALGFGFYGRAFTLQDPSCNKPGCPFSGGAKPGACTATSGFLSYYEIQDILKKKSGVKVNHDKEAAVKYFSWDNDQWISFDDADTFKQKVDWADSVGFSGSLIWASDLDDYDNTAHAGLLGRDIKDVGSALSIKTRQDESATIEDLGPLLGQGCYKQPDSVTRCHSGDIQVGYDRDGRKGDYKPICCPSSSGLTECLWRGGSGGTNAGRDCNGRCHSGEVMVDQANYGGCPHESDESKKSDCWHEGQHCTRGKKALCCQVGLFSDILDGCSWTKSVGSTCDDDEQRIAYSWDRNGWGTVFKHGNEYCCPKSKPAPLKDCHWVGKGDCADNTCAKNEITLDSSVYGDSYTGCSWGRMKSLCCDLNDDVVQTLTCDYDICKDHEYASACEDEAGYNDVEGYSTSFRKRSYIGLHGRTLWSYDAVDPGTQESGLHSRALPGQARQKILLLDKLLGSVIYAGKELKVTSRPYWPGLGSLTGDGASTLTLQGGFNMLKDTCAATGIKYIPCVSLPTKGFQLEHIREVNMITKFVESMITGYKFSGEPMTTKFDPLDILNGWNQKYPVSLPRIGAIVKDATEFVEPLTPNDRIYEIIGSYAYRGGLSFLPGDMNLLKRTLLAGNNPLGGLSGWKTLVNNIGKSGDIVSAEKLIGTMQKAIGVFNYLNDDVLQIGFSESGKLLVKELKYAEEYIPQLKGIVAAWAEWETDYYDNAVRSAASWLTTRSSYIIDKFPNGGTTVNPAVSKLVYETIQLAKQKNRIMSPL
nr:hypothetical protein F4802DRAFT_556676 [Xylaria palmicola]